MVIWNLAKKASDRCGYSDQTPAGQSPGNQIKRNPMIIKQSKTERRQSNEDVLVHTKMPILPANVIHKLLHCNSINT
jgi:hypothetical protein